VSNPSAAAYSFTLRSSWAFKATITVLADISSAPTAGESRMPTAFFRRAQAELSLGQTSNAVADFRQIIEQFPTASEAALAKAELQKLGVKTTAEPPKPVRRKSR